RKSISEGVKRMSLTELYNLLKATGYPVAYSHFNEPKGRPFITYLTTYTSNFHADNKVHQKVKNVDVELYTSKKDLQAEQTLEGLLNEHELPFDKVETYIDSEKIYQIIYEVRLF